MQLLELHSIRQSGSIGVSLMIHWPINQFAFGYVAGTELTIGSISSFTGHLLFGIFELRFVKVSVDKEAGDPVKDSFKMLKKFSNED